MSKNQTFLEKLYECEQHKLRLNIAKGYLKKFMPLTKDSYKNLNDINVGFIDQLIFRFSKLQDTLGDKLFSSFLELTGEEVKKMTFIDRLNRLEELEIVYKNEWMNLRKSRNEIAHEYSFNIDEVIDSINEIYDISDKLIDIYNTFYSYCYEKFNFIKDSEILRNRVDDTR